MGRDIELQITDGWWIQRTTGWGGGGGGGVYRKTDGKWSGGC